MIRLSTLIFCLFFILISCKKSTTSEDTFSSKESLYVEYISAFTQGYISSASEIRVKLSKSLDTATPGKEVGMDVFDFSPGIKGEAYWEDNRTIIYRPANKLESGQEYKATFLLNKLIETAEDREEFKFTFHCIPQNFDVKVSGLGLYDVSDLTKVKISGTLITADVTPDEEVEKLISASQNGKDLEISFEHNAGENQHNFTVENVKRAEERGKVKILWNGEPIGVEKEGETEYEIPSLSEYTVTSVDIVRAPDNYNYISVLFSDPIDDKQNLRGLVQLSQGTRPRVVVEQNEMKVYPTSQLQGSVNLTINKSIKNSAGYSLENDYTTSIQFSQIKPEVKLATNKGVIMPSSEGLVVPFEAVSLQAVDLTIVRIFENNVLQFLQTQNYENYYNNELKRAGRPVVKKRIALNTTGVTDLNNWNRYTIDISEYVKVEPGALYEVRLNFKQSYSMYFCESPDADPLFEQIEESWEYEEEDDWITMTITTTTIGKIVTIHVIRHIIQIAGKSRKYCLVPIWVS